MVFGVAEWIPTNQQRDAIGIFRMCHPIDQTAAISAVAWRHAPGSTEGNLVKIFHQWEEAGIPLDAFRK